MGSINGVLEISREEGLVTGNGLRRLWSWATDSLSLSPAELGCESSRWSRVWRLSNLVERVDLFCLGLH